MLWEQTPTDLEFVAATGDQFKVTDTGAIFMEGALIGRLRTYERIYTPPANISSPSTASPRRADDDHRIVVLEPPAYARTWSATRTFPGLRSTMSLDRSMSSAEVKTWIDRIEAESRD